MADWRLSRSERKEYSGANVSRGAAHAKGAYVELTAATSFAYQAISIGIYGGGAGGQCWLVDIAIGPAGAEQVIVPNILMDSQRAANSNQTFITLPFLIPAGSRISARAQETGGGGTRNINVSAIGRAGGVNYGHPACGPVVNYGANPATTNGILVDQGATLDTFGAWTEIAAATERVHNMLIAILGTNQQVSSGLGTGSYNFQIGIGPAGYEVPIDEMQTCVVSSVNRFMQASFETYAAIPAGTRLSMRAKSPSLNTAASRMATAIILGV